MYLCRKCTCSHTEIDVADDDDDDDNNNNNHSDDDDDDDDDDEDDEDKKKNDDADDDDDDDTTTTATTTTDIRTERRNLRFLQCPHCAAKCLQDVRSSGFGTTVCKSRAIHRELITCNASCATWYKGAAQLLSFSE